VIKQIWAGHRTLAVAVGAVAALAIVLSALLLVVGPLHSSPAVSPGASQIAAASPSATETVTPLPSGTPDTSPTALPAGWGYSDLDGVAAPNDLAHRLPLAIMIDDQAVARPQSGISSASIVYQAPADGGEDRYMMVFQEGTASDIGPVRSARPYFVYWAAEYKAVYCHFGGDAQSLQHVIPAMLGAIYNMDAISNHCPYRRVTTRVGPHNAYTTSSDVIAAAAAMHYPSVYQNLPTRTFRDDTPLLQRPASQVVTIDYRTGTVGYRYDPGTDKYLRIMDGKPEIDPADGSQVYARNVVAMYQSVTIDPYSEPGHNRPDVHNVGSGKATIFLEGQAIDATWTKTSNTALTRFYDSAGNEIPLVRGEIFIQSVPPAASVTVG
jgi:hypothetical protein